jgi:hypothetical protein
MQQPQIVGRLLLPADQYPAETVHPTVRPLHHPPASLVARLPLDRLRLLPPRPQVQREPELRQQGADAVEVIAKS